MDKERIIFIEIKCLDGLFYFSNKHIHSNKFLLEDVELEDLNSIEEIVEAILDVDCKNIAFQYDLDNCKLIQAITKKLIVDSTINVIWITQIIEKAMYYIYHNSKIYICNDIDSFDSRTKVATNDNFCVDQVKHYGKVFEPLMTGYISFMTGMYPDEIEHTLSKHVEVSDFNMIKNELTDIVDINSAIILTKKIEKIENVDAIYPHIHCHDQDGSIYFDLINKVDISEINYKDYKSSEKKQVMLRITDMDDLQCFMDDLDAFKDCGLINKAETMLVDECKWRGKCQMSELYRCRVLDNGNVAPCRLSDKTIAHYTEEHYKKLILASKYMLVCQRERECNKCNAKKYCAKCTMLPEGIGYEAYCDVIKKHPFLQEYFLKKRIAAHLMENTHVLGKYMKEGYKFDSQVKPFLYPIKRDGDRTYEMKRIVVMISTNGKYYCFNVSNGDVIQIDERLVFIAEGHSVGDNESKIIESFMDFYHLEAVEAASIVKQGIELLRNAAIIF